MSDCSTHAFDRPPLYDSMLFYRSIKIYIIGPVTGLVDDNRLAFEEAKSTIQMLGYENVEIPHDTILPGTGWKIAMRRSITRLLAADVVVALPGHGSSIGASLERDLARALDIPVYPLVYRDLDNYEFEVLQADFEDFLRARLKRPEPFLCPDLEDLNATLGRP